MVLEGDARTRPLEHIIDIEGLVCDDANHAIALVLTIARRLCAYKKRQTWWPAQRHMAGSLAGFLTARSK